MSEGDAEHGELIDAATLPGVPDEFQRLWTPHRMAYITAGADVNRGSGCPFCAAPQRTDAEGLIVHRGQTAYVLLNLFPYNSGHMLVCPYRHIPTYDQATAEEVAEIVRDLWRREQDRGLSAGEKRMLAKARQILVSELALAEKTDEDKAEVMLDEVLAS